MRKIVQRGNIILVNLNPTKGHEQSGLRPAVVISGNDFHVSGLCFVCPLTTKLKHYFGGLILEPNIDNGLEGKSEVLISQIRTIDSSRAIKTLGSISQEGLDQIYWGLDQLMDR